MLAKCTWLESWLILLPEETEHKWDLPMRLHYQLLNQIHDSLLPYPFCLPSWKIPTPFCTPPLHQVPNRDVATQTGCPLSPNIFDASNCLVLIAGKVVTIFPVPLVHACAFNTKLLHYGGPLQVLARGYSIHMLGCSGGRWVYAWEWQLTPYLCWRRQQLRWDNGTW